MQQDHFVQKPPCNTTVWVYNNRLCNCDIFRPGNCAPSPPLPHPPQTSHNYLFQCKQRGGWYWEKLGIFSVLGIQVKILSSKSDLPIENKLTGIATFGEKLFQVWRRYETPATKEKTGYKGCEDCVCFSAKLVRRPPLNQYFSLTSSLINWRRVG